MNSLRSHWPLIIAICVLLVTLATVLVISARQNDMHLIYPLDDAYIHMAMAKNLAQHGIWGITKHSFTSSSSSLLWTLLLSFIYFIFGVNTMTPLIVNAIAATLVCILVYVILRRCLFRSLPVLVTLLLIVFLTPLTSLVYAGLEHTLHLLISICFVYLAANALSTAKHSGLQPVLLLVLAPLLIMTRYEGVFLVAVVVGLYFMRRKMVFPLLLAGLASLPVFIYGALSFSRGWHLLPNPVVLKGNRPELSSLRSVCAFLLDPIARLAEVKTSHISMVLLVALVLLYFNLKRERRIWSEHAIMLIILIAGTYLHMLFARTGWFFRYEAYLIGLGVFVIALALHQQLLQQYRGGNYGNRLRGYFPWAMLLLVAIIPPSVRGVTAVRRMSQASRNIYGQQYQMGLFVRMFYSGESIAANDIGAISYLADIKMLDLAGLASLEVEQAMRSGCYCAETVRDLVMAKDVKVVMAYEYMLRRHGGVPTDWVNAGQWTISDNVVCGAPTISFYATGFAETDNLIKNLKAFSSHLPKDIVETGEYTK